jgi:hypothetical protein
LSPDPSQLSFRELDAAQKGKTTQNSIGSEIRKLNVAGCFRSGERPCFVLFQAGNLKLDCAKADTGGKAQDRIAMDAG